MTRATFDSPSESRLRRGAGPVRGSSGRPQARRVEAEVAVQPAGSARSTKPASSVTSTANRAAPLPISAGAECTDPGRRIEVDRVDRAAHGEPGRVGSAIRDDRQRVASPGMVAGAGAKTSPPHRRGTAFSPAAQTRIGSRSSITMRSVSGSPTPTCALDTVGSSRTRASRAPVETGRGSCRVRDRAAASISAGVREPG